MTSGHHLRHPVPETLCPTIMSLLRAKPRRFSDGEASLSQAMTHGGRSCEAGDAAAGFGQPADLLQNPR